MKKISNLVKKILAVVCLLMAILSIVAFTISDTTLVATVKSVFSRENVEKIKEEGIKSVFLNVSKNSDSLVGAVWQENFDAALDISAAISTDNRYPVLTYFSNAGDVTTTRWITYTLYGKAQTDASYSVKKTSYGYSYSNGNQTFNDQNSTDKAVPNAPEVTVTTTSNYTVNLSAVDQGTTYNYYYTTKTGSNAGYGNTMWSNSVWGNMYGNFTGGGDTGEVIERTSKTVDAVVTSGIEGYYYIVDNNLTNDFNISTATYTTDSSISLDSSNSG